MYTLYHHHRLHKFCCPTDNLNSSVFFSLSSYTVMNFLAMAKKLIKLSFFLSPPLFACIFIRLATWISFNCWCRYCTCCWTHYRLLFGRCDSTTCTWCAMTFGDDHRFECNLHLRAMHLMMVGCCWWRLQLHDCWCWR